MQKLIINGYEVEIFDCYYGEELFITKDGDKVYSARCHKGKALERANDVIGRQ